MFDAEEVGGDELLRIIEEEARTQVIAHIAHESHSGPMPSPRQLAMYDAALPGTAQVIRDEFQKNADHVRVTESKVLEYTKDDNDQNRRVAERLVWGAIASVLVLAWMEAYAVAGTVAVSIVGAVITGFLKQRGRAERKVRLAAKQSKDQPENTNLDPHEQDPLEKKE